MSSKKVAQLYQSIHPASKKKKKSKELSDTFKLIIINASVNRPHNVLTMHIYYWKLIVDNFSVFLRTKVHHYFILHTFCDGLVLCPI